MRSTTSSALLLSTDCILPTTACYLPATYYLLLLLTTDCVLLTTGFPSNMGENGVKMTLAVFGEVVDFTAEESDDGMSMGGRVTYEDVAAAKAAIDKYDGVDMGLGTTLELQAL